MNQFMLSFSCGTDDLIFDSRIICYRDEFVVDSVIVRSSGPVAAKQA